jgi:hypothetical protein
MQQQPRFKETKRPGKRFADRSRSRSPPRSADLHFYEQMPPASFMLPPTHPLMQNMHHHHHHHPHPHHLNHSQALTNPAAAAAVHFAQSQLLKSYQEQHQQLQNGPSSSIEQYQQLLKLQNSGPVFSGQQLKLLTQLYQSQQPGGPSNAIRASAPISPGSATSPPAPSMLSDFFKMTATANGFASFLNTRSENSNNPTTLAVSSSSGRKSSME